MRAESFIQIEIVNRLSELARANEFFFFSVPNEGFMQAAVGRGQVIHQTISAMLGTLKKMGMTSGVPDLVIVQRGRAYFIEVKGPDGKLSPTQRIVAKRLNECGARVHVVRSLGEMEQLLIDWRIVK